MITMLFKDICIGHSWLKDLNLISEFMWCFVV